MHFQCLLWPWRKGMSMRWRLDCGGRRNVSQSHLCKLWRKLLRELLVQIGLERGLHCRDGKCTCIDNSMDYDSTKEACFRILGSKLGCWPKFDISTRKMSFTHSKPLFKCSEHQLFSKLPRKCFPVHSDPDALTFISWAKDRDSEMMDARKVVL